MMDRLGELAAAVGRREAVVSDPDIIASACSDWRGWYKGRALALVRPRSVAEVQRTVRACARLDIPLVPQGGNTSLVGGSVPSPDGTSVVISLAGLDGIRTVDPVGWSMTAEAGCTLAALQKAAADNDRHFGLDLGARDSARLGGLIGTNAGGMGSIRYGSVREQVLGLEVVLPDGSLWEGLRALRKDNSGFALKHLFIGAEGTLGVVTAATLALHAPERHSATVLFALSGFDAINPATDRLIAAGSLSALELMPSWAMELACAEVVRCPMPLRSPASWCLQARFAGAAAVQAHAEATAAGLIEAGLASDAVLAQSAAQEAQLWAIRDAFAPVHAALGHSFRFDLSVPLGRIPELIRRLEASLARIAPGCRALAFGHLGDGNVHFSACQPPGGDANAFRAKRHAIEHAVNETCWTLGGSISAEHGIGQLHRAELVGQKSAEELGLQRGIKALLDPRGLFNPGKLLP